MAGLSLRGLVFLVLLPAGCSGDPVREGSAVWSNDESETIAISVLEWDRVTSGGAFDRATHMRNPRSEIWLANRDGSNPRLLFERTGVASSMYLALEAGYVAVLWQDVVKLALIVNVSNGTVLESSPDGTVEAVIPSPDGSVLATVVHPVVDPALPPDAAAVVVRFIDPFTLAERGRGTISVEQWTTWEFPDDYIAMRQQMWIDNEEFRLGTVSFFVDGGMVQDQAPPRCSDAPTAGGRFTSDGLRLVVEDAEVGCFEVSAMPSGDAGWPARCAP